MSETSSLTGPLLKMYKQAGALAFRMQSGRIAIGRRWIYLCEAGTADLLVFPRKGGIVWVETKDLNGKTEKARKQKQTEFRISVEEMGHKYIVAKTIDQGLEAVR